VNLDTAQANFSAFDSFWAYTLVVLSVGIFLGVLFTVLTVMYLSLPIASLLCFVFNHSWAPSNPEFHDWNGRYCPRCRAEDIWIRDNFTRKLHRDVNQMITEHNKLNWEVQARRVG
jgi:hypothetical protein